MVSIARIERPPLYRGGSASKKDGCLPPRILLRARVLRGVTEGHSGFPAGGQVFESAVAVGKDFDGSEGFDRIQVDTGRDSR